MHFVRARMYPITAKTELHEIAVTSFTVFAILESKFYSALKFCYFLFQIYWHNDALRGKRKNVQIIQALKMPKVRISHVKGFLIHNLKKIFCVLLCTSTVQFVKIRFVGVEMKLTDSCLFSFRFTYLLFSWKISAF